MSTQQHISARAAGVQDHMAPAQTWDDTTPTTRTIKRLLAIGVVGSVLLTATWLIAGATRPDYDAWRQPISALSLGPGGWVQSVNFILFGLVIGCSTLGYRMALAPDLGALAIPVLRVLAALGLIADGLFAQDPANGYPLGSAAPLSPTLHGTIHQIGAIVAITALAVSCFVFAVRFAHEPGWRVWGPFAVAAGVLTIVFIAAFGAAIAHGPTGLLERLASETQALFSLAVSARLLVGTGRVSSRDTIPRGVSVARS